MLKAFIKKIPGARWAYHNARVLAFKIQNFPRALGSLKLLCKRIVFKVIRTVVSLYRSQMNRLKCHLRRKERESFIKSVDQWDFDSDFAELLTLAKEDHGYLEELGNRLIKSDKANPKGYALVQASLIQKPKVGHYDVGQYALFA